MKLSAATLGVQAAYGGARRNLVSGGTQYGIMACHSLTFFASSLSASRRRPNGFMRFPRPGKIRVTLAAVSGSG